MNPNDEHRSDVDYRRRLTPEQYRVTREGGTEHAFTGEHWDTKTAGTYSCVCCQQELYSSVAKFDSGSGWPSFWQVIADEAVTEKTDTSGGMVRTELVCSRCDAHLGHMFPDGPPPTGARHCINSASLEFLKEPD